MSTLDEEFIKRLRETFSVEANEHLYAISSGLIELEKSPSPDVALATIESIYREAHTLKGAARAVDFQDIESLCQTLEETFSAWKRQRTIPSSAAFDVLHKSLDMIRVCLVSPDAGENADTRGMRGELTRQLTELQSHGKSPDHREAPGMALAPEPAPFAGPGPSQAIDLERPGGTDTVRISLDKLDACLLQAEDMLTVKGMIAQCTANVRAITATFDRWQREWEKISSPLRGLRRAVEERDRGRAAAQPVADSAALIDFLEWNRDYVRALENRLVSLAAQTDQDSQGTSRRVDDLIEGSKKLLMLPFSTVAALFPKLIRDLCRDQGKEAELIIRGGDVEIDKRILDEMKDPLIHVLRNCIDHGVEKPTERQRLGKPARANVTVAVSQINGSKVEILVSDDGAGVDVERVKDSAVAHNILSTDEARSLNETEALALIFHSEVTTTSMVTAISGRGLGMAIVREKTERLGGRVVMESRRYVGTKLRIVLPLMMATFRGVFVTAAGSKFVVPIVSVERVLRAKPQDIQTVENRETITVQGRAVSLVRLDTVLQLSFNARPAERPSHLPVIVLHSGDQRIAFVVDDVLREEEVLVKPLLKPLLRVRNIAGVTVLGSGTPVPILNVSDLMKSARLHGAPPLRSMAPAEESKVEAKRVLVVEDSITSRMLLKSILESAGYQVKTAVDGIDAFTALREDRFDLVVSDVEMPRMNGLALTSKIRADKRLGEIPVVLVTALESSKQRELGIDAGANAYVVKSSFDQGNLLEIVRRWI